MPASCYPSEPFVLSSPIYPTSTPKLESLPSSSSEDDLDKGTTMKGFLSKEDASGSDPEFYPFIDSSTPIKEKTREEPQHSNFNFTPTRKEKEQDKESLIDTLFSKMEIPNQEPIRRGGERDHHCPVIKNSRTFSEKFYLELEIIMELLNAILYGSWGIFVGIILSFIPRRFRYKDVKGQIVLITGAGSGIGKLMAKKFALKHGAIVVAWDINIAGNKDTVDSIRASGGECHGFICDVSSRESIYKAAEKVKAEVGKVDILINNAGIVFGKRLLESTDENIIKTFEVNALSNFWTTKAFLPDMLATRRGHIVTIASLAGLFGTNRLVDYCASKFAAVGFDEALKNEIKGELGHDEIQATLVCPYYINTGMFDGVRSKIIPLLSPEPVVNDIVAGILTNQEQIVIPRYVYILIVLRLLVPGEVGRRIATAFGITGAMLTFKGNKMTPSRQQPSLKTTPNNNKH